jgi:hypothetical protein
MKTKGVVLILACLALLLSRGTRGAQVGALQCLRGGRTIDTTVCLSCHDGSLAYNFKLNAPNSARNGLCGVHSVALSYKSAYARRPAEFVPPGLLNSRVRLINGQVQCLTCHTTSANGTWMALKGPGNRPLCLSCHRK